MKYWNKKRGREGWHAIEMSDCYMNHVAPNSSIRHSRSYVYGVQLKAWCQNYPSKGRFYYKYFGRFWYFEYEQDAIMFSLTWVK
jgi:N-acetyl-beta-hexosaminidase